MGKNWRAVRDEKYARGECYLCERPAALPERHCEHHLEVMRNRTRAWREERMAKGLCVQCGADKRPEGRLDKRLCVACTDKMAAWQRRRRSR